MRINENKRTEGIDFSVRKISKVWQIKLNNMNKIKRKHNKEKKNRESNFKREKSDKHRWFQVAEK